MPVSSSGRQTGPQRCITKTTKQLLRHLNPKPSTAYKQEYGNANKVCEVEDTNSEN